MLSMNMACRYRSPAYETDPDRLKIVAKDQWDAPPAKPSDDSHTEP
jgi:hypothetical protein